MLLLHNSLTAATTETTPTTLSPGYRTIFHYFTYADCSFNYHFLSLSELFGGGVKVFLGMLDRYLSQDAFFMPIYTVSKRWMENDVTI